MTGVWGSFISRLARDYIFAAKLIIATVVALLATWLYLAGTLDRFENLTLDQRFRVRGRQFVHPKIVMVEVAEDSIRRIGRWPWDREWHATAVKALKDFGAKSVGFDVLFPEGANPETDLLFAKMIESSKNVFLSVAFQEHTGDRGLDLIQSMDAFRKGAKGEGHISILPDEDGILRRIRPRFKTESRDYYQLGMVMALDFLGADPKQLSIKKGEAVVPIPGNPDLRIPLTEEGDLLINWSGKWVESFHHVSFIDLVVSYTQYLKKEPTLVPLEIFQGSICLIGVSATGLFDIRSSPLEPAYPAMGVNATILNSILERGFVHSISKGWNIAVLWILSSIILLVMVRANYLQTMGIILIVAMAYIAFAFAIFSIAGIILPVVCPILLILISYLAITAFHQIVISIEKNRLVKLATTDTLTGLYNIGHFKRLLQAELISVQLRNKQDIGLVMVDGDKFKYVNDTFGHQAGDEVLRAFGEILKGSCRALDVAARYGGEEFVVMLPGAKTEHALSLAEKIRAAIQAREFNLGPQKIRHPVTASFGVTSYKQGDTMEEFLRRADEALYEAKHTGRNKVCAKL